MCLNVVFKYCMCTSCARCLETGVLIKGDNRRKEGEAHCHVGLALENRGEDACVCIIDGCIREHVLWIHSNEIDK